MGKVLPTLAKLQAALPAGYSAVPGVLDYAIIHQGEPIIRFDDPDDLLAFLERYAAALKP